MSDLVPRDARFCWHPFTQHHAAAPPLAVRSAKGARLTLEDGRELIDGISSWWTILHGHGEESLIEAMRDQAARLDHVLFAGATHEPAVRLAEELAACSPGKLRRSFFSDDGSTAVEVALKIALQSHHNRGEPQRRVFVAFDGGYHGDTFGSMSVGDPSEFFAPFAPLLFEVERVPVEARAAEEALGRLGERAAGVIIEPLVQGAAGMRMHGPDLLRSLRGSCDAHAIPLIADEVMTGFGRTGTLFACEQAEIAPDLMTLAKGLTGGIFPLSVTLATEELFESFLSEDRSRMLLHGHSYTAHPVGCAVALASLKLVRERNLPARLASIGGRLASGLRTSLDGHRALESLRVRGGIVALDLAAGGYFDESLAEVGERAARMGALLRPLGSVLYALPPACISDEDVDRLAEIMSALVSSMTR